MLSTVLILALLPFAAMAMDCAGAPDGNYEIGCRTFTTCSGGQATVTACEDDLVYNSDTGKCDEIGNVKPPCGQFKDCSRMDDGHYPDLDNQCRSYYTCVDRHFLAHNFCPASLVFNTENESCDWPDNVKPPCGTAAAAAAAA